MASTDQYYSIIDMPQLEAHAMIRGVSPDGTSGEIITRLRAQDRETGTHPNAGAHIQKITSTTKDAAPIAAESIDSAADNASDANGDWQTVKKGKKGKPAVYKSFSSEEQDRAIRAADLAQGKPKEMDRLYQEWSESIGYAAGAVNESGVSEDADSEKEIAIGEEETTEEYKAPHSTFAEISSSGSSAPAPKKIIDIQVKATEDVTKEPEVSHKTNVEINSTSSSSSAASEVEAGSSGGATVTPTTDEEGFTLVSSKNANESVAKETAPVQENLSSPDIIEQVEEPVKKKKKRGKKGGRKVNKNKAQPVGDMQDDVSATDPAASKASEDIPAASPQAATEPPEVSPATTAVVDKINSDAEEQSSEFINFSVTQKNATEIDKIINEAFPSGATLEKVQPVDIQTSLSSTQAKSESSEDLPASSTSSSTGKNKPVDFFPPVPSPLPSTQAKATQKASNKKRGKKVTKKHDDSKVINTSNTFNSLSFEDVSGSESTTKSDDGAVYVEEKTTEATESLPQKDKKKRGKKGGKAVQQKAQKRAQAAAHAAFYRGILATAALFAVVVVALGLSANLKS